MRPTLRQFAGAALLFLGIGACSDSGTSESISPNLQSKLYVNLSVDSDTIAELATRQVSARVTDEIGSLKLVPVTWTSTDPTVASVSGGMITGVSAGTAMVIASAGTGADSAKIVVTPSETVLDIQPSAAVVALGDTIEFIATTRDQNGNVIAVGQLTWSSSDTTAASFVRAGSLVAKAEGELEVSAAAAYRQGTGSVRVFKTPVSSVTIAPSVANVYKGAELELVVTLRDQQGRLVEGGVTFGSTDPSKATVSQDGVVTGVSAGSVIITATSGTRTGSATVNVLGAPAASVSISLPSDTVPTGIEVQATVTVLDASGSQVSGKTIGYQSSNPSVATVNSTGIVKGVVDGSTTISAIVDGKVGSKRITVGGRRAARIAVSPGSASISAGQASQLNAKVLDQSGTEMTGQPISWQSGNPAVAHVSSSGLVTAMSAGSSTITAVSGTLSSSASVSVVNAPVASVLIAPATLSMVMGGTPATLSVNAFDAAGNQLSGRVATWSSQNPTVASVNSSGAVTAIAVGSTTISANIEGKSASVTVSVGNAPPAPVASITVTLANASLSVGQQSQASAVVRDAQGNTLSRPLTWSSLDTAVAKVSSAGLVTAVGGGTVTIIARYEDHSGYAALTVTAASPAPVAQVILTVPTQSLTSGQTVQSSVTLKDAQGNVLSGRTISYSTLNSSVVTVSATGLITAMGAGTTTVRATSGGVSGEASFTVSGPTSTVASITVTPASAALSVGQFSQETAVAKDASGNVVNASFTWTTSNPTVAQVSSSGRVSAVAAGAATIRAAASGVTGSMSVSVASAPATVATVTVTLSNPTFQVGGNAQATAVAKDASGNVMSGQAFTWTTSSASVAAVSTSGLVTGGSAGTAQIRATSGAIVGTANVTITAPVAPLPPPSGAMPTITALVGQSKSITETAAMGAAFAEYDRLFNQYFPIINEPSNPNRLDDYYDRAKAYYARYVRTGDSKFLALGDEVALAYRQWLQSNTYGTQPHWSQVLGLELHYRLTGDTLSRRAVAGLFAHSLSSYTTAMWGPLADIENPNSSYMENRIQARALQGALSAYRMNASYTRPDGLAFAASGWPTRLRDILNKILSTQKSDGSYAWIQICGGQLNYMVGMLNDVLIEYYRDFEQDPRILASVANANEYMWTTQWLPASKSFNYASVMCSPNAFGASVGGPSPAGDLNGLFIASYGWLYNRTGDAKWKTRGDEIMAGLVLPVWAGSYGSSKQFNQAFAESYRYLGWR